MCDKIAISAYLLKIVENDPFLTLLPTGGFLSHTTILLAATLKPLTLWLPNFVTYCIYLFATISENFSKIDLPGGLIQSFFKRDFMKN